MSIRPIVFIGSSTEKLDLAYAIQACLDDTADAIVWTQGVFNLSGGYLEEIVHSLDKADFGVFVFSPDDSVRIRTEEYVAVRDNVVFEYGLFVGRLGRRRSFFVVPKGAQNLWLPTDLAGIVAATYRPSQGNLQAALGPACSSIRDVIKKLGWRSNRFKLRNPEQQSARYESLRGIWQGYAEQRSASKGYSGTATLTIQLIPGTDGIYGTGTYKFADIPEMDMELTGSFHHDRFVRIDYANSQGKVMQFGCATIELNGRGDKMEGEYVGYGAWSETVVSGTIAVSRI